MKCPKCKTRWDWSSYTVSKKHYEPTCQQCKYKFAEEDMLPQRIKTETVASFIFNLVEAGAFFDIVVESTYENLKTLKKHLKIDSKIFKQSKWNQKLSLIVIDTCDTEEDAEVLFEQAKTTIFKIL